MGSRSDKTNQQSMVRQVGNTPATCENKRCGMTSNQQTIQARKMRGKRCEICSSDKDLCAHHVNGDRSDNRRCNIQTLCRSCHTLVHIERGDIKRPPIPKRKSYRGVIECSSGRKFGTTEITKQRDPVFA